MKAALIASLLVVVPGMTDVWNVRPWDTRLTLPEIEDYVIGNKIAFPDGAVAIYGDDGSYSYIYDGGNRFDGKYTMASDGSLCVTFENGRGRCDLYVLQGERLMLINEEGGRFLTADTDPE